MIIFVIRACRYLNMLSRANAERRGVEGSQRGGREVG